MELFIWMISSSASLGILSYAATEIYNTYTHTI